jgi:hypothetical protein
MKRIKKEQSKSSKKYKSLLGKEKLIITKTASITVPKKMLYMNNEGEQKIINTLTKTGKLTNRDKQPIINLISKDDNYVGVSNMGKTLLDRTYKIKKEIRDTRTKKFNEFYDTIRKINDIRDNIKKLEKIEKPNKNHKAKLIELNKELDEAIKDSKRKEKIHQMYRSDIHKIN